MALPGKNLGPAAQPAWNFDVLHGSPKQIAERQANKSNIFFFYYLRISAAVMTFLSPANIM